MSDCRKCAAFDWCKENEECGLFKPKTMRNADRIRAMTDEELAEFFVAIQNDVADYYDGGHAFEPDFPTHKDAWLEWLKTEKTCNDAENSEE